MEKELHWTDELKDRLVSYFEEKGYAPRSDCDICLNAEECMLNNPDFDANACKVAEMS